MDFTAFSVKLLYLAIPGILASKIYRKYRGRTKRDAVEIVLEILLFSFTAYLLVGITGLDEICAKHMLATPAHAARPANEAPFSDSLSLTLSDSFTLDWWEIAFAFPSAVVLAFGASALHTYGLVNWLGRFLRISRRSGDDDVWEYFNNSGNVEWVFIRDTQMGRTYYGYVASYSDYDEAAPQRELILREVQIYDSVTGAQLGAVDAMYIARCRDDWTIEVPVLKSIAEDRRSLCLRIIRRVVKEVRRALVRLSQKP